MSERMAIVDGELIAADAPAVPVTARGLSYGDGCFETLRSYGGRFLHLDRHLQRLRRGLDYLEMNMPESLSFGNARKMTEQLLRANGMEKEDAVIRIQAWRTGGRGYRIPKDSRVHIAMTVSKLPTVTDAIVLASVSVRRIPSEALPSRYKLSNNINYIKAMSEAAGKKADDALMQTTAGYVSETTIANIFWLREGRLFTPSEECDLLPGITRSIVMDLADESGIPEEEGRYPLHSLQEADAAFACNSVRELVPVSRIDNVTFDTAHPQLKKLQEAYREYREGHLR